MLGRNSRTAVTLALTLLALAGCRTGSGQPAAPSPPPSPPLRVGVTPSSPPFAFRQGGELVGLDVDFARALAGALGRPLQLREVDWDDQIPTLLAGRTDVIMSGMTITPARQVRMAFSDPYLSSGLLAVVRRGDRDRYPDGKTVLRKVSGVGVVVRAQDDREWRIGWTEWQAAVFEFADRVSAFYAACSPKQPYDEDAPGFRKFKAEWERRRGQSLGRAL